MTKRGILTLLLISILFLTACSTIDFSNLFGKSNISSGKGIKMEFVEYPKGTLTDNEPFRVKLRLSNYGKGAVYGVLCMMDTPSERFGGIPPDQCQSVQLLGSEELSAGKISPYTQEFYFPETGEYYYKNIQKDIAQSSILSASFRYAVESKASVKICLKKMNADIKNIPIPCSESQTLTDIQQPDYPLIISKVEKEVNNLGANDIRLKLKIYVKQNEDGTLVDKNKVLEDQPDLTPTVAFKTDLLDNKAIFTCAPLKDAKFELRENEKVINCYTTLNIGQEYLYDTLIIELGYGFKKTAPLPAIRLESSQIA